MDASASSSVPRVIEASRTTSLARSEVVRFTWDQEIDTTIIHKGVHMVDLCLTPRPKGACARFADVWARNRYERFGKVFLLPAGFTTRTRAAAGRQKSVITWLDTRTLSEWLEAEGNWSDKWLSSTLDIHAPQIRHIMTRIAHELESPGFAGDVMTDLLNMQLAIELGRYFRSLPDRTTGGLAPWRLRLIDERITDGRTPPTLEDLARLVNLSVRQLTRGFRDSRGVSIGAYIEDRRIADARTLLGGTRSIKEIAYLMGFATPSGFSYAFRTVTGETPRAYRSRMRSHTARVAS